MKTSKSSKQVRLDDDQHAELQFISLRSNLSIASLIRLAVRHYLPELRKNYITK